MKLAFFDIDGTLSAPEYRNEKGEPVIGFTPEGWLAYCRREGKNAYAHCRVVPGIKEFAEALKEEGRVLFVLSVSLSPEEDEAKTAFIRSRFPGLFGELFIVRKDGDKIPAIFDTARRYGAEAGDCMLIEDTFPTLLAAHAEGIQAVHISNVLAGNVSR